MLEIFNPLKVTINKKIYENMVNDIIDILLRYSDRNYVRINEKKRGLHVYVRINAIEHEIIIKTKNIHLDINRFKIIPMRKSFMVRRIERYQNIILKESLTPLSIQVLDLILKSKNGLTIRQIAKRLNKSSGLIAYHIRKLLINRLVIKKGSTYYANV